MLGFNYGTNLAVFPAACKDYFGIRNFGLNYGCLFAAFGSAGLIMPWVNGFIEDRTGSGDLSYAIIIGLLVVRRGAGRGEQGSSASRAPRRGGVLVAEEGTELMAIVTISRGSFSGGVAVAEAVAERLGVPCISREVVRDAAQASGVDEGSLQATLEEPPRFWEKTPGRIPAHLNLVRTALLQRARGGDFVYHGYAGHLLLSGIAARAARARDRRARRTASRRPCATSGMNEKQAAQYVEDAQRPAQEVDQVPVRRGLAGPVAVRRRAPRRPGGRGGRRGHDRAA